jgi:hypothetical protein
MVAAEPDFHCCGRYLAANYFGLVREPLRTECRGTNTLADRCRCCSALALLSTHDKTPSASQRDVGAVFAPPRNAGRRAGQERKIALAIHECGLTPDAPCCCGQLANGIVRATTKGLGPMPAWLEVLIDIIGYAGFVAVASRGAPVGKEQGTDECAEP